MSTPDPAGTDPEESTGGTASAVAADEPAPDTPESGPADAPEAPSGTSGAGRDASAERPEGGAEETGDPEPAKDRDGDLDGDGDADRDPAGPAEGPANGAVDEEEAGKVPAAGGEGDGRSGGAGASGSALDFVPSPVFLLVLAVTGIAGWFSWNRTELELGWNDGGSVYAPFVFIIGGWIASVAVHEFAHALVAYLSGDRGLRGSGYLRLNPFAYRERRVTASGERGGGVFTGLVLPLLFVLIGGLGITGPASYTDREAVGGRGRRMLAPLAGIVASLVLAVLLAAAVTVLLPAGSVTDNWFIGGLMFLCFLNLTAALVNLLPIPGLDGYGILVPLLEAATASPRRFEGMERVARGFGLFGVIAVFGVLWLPEVQMVYLNEITGLFQAIGMPQMDVLYGDVLMRFWAS
ncbi:site-2 protease family protein [Nocardiopsis potens]|uniref:site-2 protease family protein n=1 Tax=Nocardiopsis potens TaxID=1246458 RepID=UPI000348983E|nr:site-2 protease family protein [Nocardiopsis potens]